MERDAIYKGLESLDTNNEPVWVQGVEAIYMGAVRSAVAATMEKQGDSVIEREQEALQRRRTQKQPEGSQQRSMAAPQPNMVQRRKERNLRRAGVWR